MIVPDFCNREYIAEILQTKSDPREIVRALYNLANEQKPEFEFLGFDESNIVIHHIFFATSQVFFRSEKTKAREKLIGGKTNYLYDVLLAVSDNKVAIAVPFYALAKTFFPEIDKKLAGLKIVYEKLDISNIVIRLGINGIADVLPQLTDNKYQLGVSRCQLAYSDQIERTRNIQQLIMSGDNLGVCDIYKNLIKPVINHSEDELTVTPILLGFFLIEDGVKKTSAITDRHGNFKIWIGPGVSRIERIFLLLKGIEGIEGSTYLTGNVPILQSKVINEMETQ